MKTLLKKFLFLATASIFVSSCSDFEELNEKPTAASEEQVQVEYFINNSIISAQQNPDVAERAFVLYWKAAGRMDRINSLPVGSTNDGWTDAYYNQVATWLNHANTAIQIADDKLMQPEAQVYTNNLKQVARIWRAYLMSEMSDNFGPIAIESFQGVNPNFNSVEDVYYYVLDELKMAVLDMDDLEAGVISDRIKNLDPAYKYDFEKWKAYANSMRMRLAMRLSEADPAKAQAEFEDAAQGSNFISGPDLTFKVAEKAGWDALTGVMSREWNDQYLSPTLNNLLVGLGGIKSENLLSEDLHKYIKPKNYMGLMLEQHFTTLTTNPVAGYWFDGLPEIIDPRAYEAYIIPGDFADPELNRYPSWAPDATSETTRSLVDVDGNVVKEIDAAYTWNAPTLGSWGEKGAKNNVYEWPATTPRLANRFRNSTSERIFFAPWETYFLVAEAAVRGWDVPMDGKTAYEEGVRQSFMYWNVSTYADGYLGSQDYNNVGTSVNWDHTAEPPANIPMDFVNGYTGAKGTTTYKYPSNAVYKGGAVKNDLLTKIITQKFIAQVPWLPLETWSDQRRLGLPFFETPAVENPLDNMPQLTKSNYMNVTENFFPQRLTYPSNVVNNVPEYSQALEFLGGDDSVFTPLWWAKK